MPEIRTFQVGEDGEGARLDRLLAALCPDLSRTYIQELIGDGQVLVGGTPAKSSRKMAEGETVSIGIPDPAPAEILPEKMNLRILYEDKDVIIIDKPKGLPVHPAPGHASGTLVNGLMEHCGSELSGIGGALRPGIVHRIDMNTTGSLIVCKNDRAHRSVSEQLKEHSITRVYLGIVYGCPQEDEGTVEGPIGRSARDRKKMAVVREGGKPAVTHYRVVERFRGYSLLEFRLETGRTHQIRVHMASIGHPLVGDDVYGPKECPFNLTGQTLHASVIGFIHPSTGQYMEFTAPLPEYFSRLIETLRGKGRP